MEKLNTKNGLWNWFCCGEHLVKLMKTTGLFCIASIQNKASAPWTCNIGATLEYMMNE